MMKTRCRQCRKRLTLPDGSVVEFCSGDCRDRFARRSGERTPWPSFAGAPCPYCGEGVVKYGVTCGASHCRKSNALYLDAYRRTGGALERVDCRTITPEPDGTCGVCRLPDDGTWTVDHIHPLAKGGSHTPSNLRLVHATCNFRKAASW